LEDHLPSLVGHAAGDFDNADGRRSMPMMLLVLIFILTIFPAMTLGLVQKALSHSVHARVVTVPPLVPRRPPSSSSSPVPRRTQVSKSSL
jgi:hypothetical protein